MPFDYNWSACNILAVGAGLGLSRLQSAARAEARATLLINLWLAGPAGRVFYSRSNDVYARHARWAP
ncbi:MAG: hypothetical protein ABWZ74_04490, partial [Hyphomicrobiaceae bacterium]